LLRYTDPNAFVNRIYSYANTFTYIEYRVADSKYPYAITIYAISDAN
jgi:hypothetical protein